MVDAEHAKIQDKVDRLARVMDDAIRVPGTNFRIGWDGILGFIPGLGGIVTIVSHLYMVSQASRVGIRKRIYAKMILNALIDFLIGVIPGVGDVCDIFWKSNRKNAELLKSEIARHASRSTDSSPSH
jgi:hypothetical protein